MRKFIIEWDKIAIQSWHWKGMYTASEDDGDQRKDGISDCADMGLTVHDAIHLAQDRDAWRRSIAKLPLRAPAGALPRH